MLEALGLPTHSAGWGYRDIIYGGESYTGPPLGSPPSPRYVWSWGLVAQVTVQLGWQRSGYPGGSQDAEVLGHSAVWQDGLDGQRIR